MSAPCIFEFFETISAELGGNNSRVITASDLTTRGTSSSLLDDLKVATKKANNDEAIEEAVNILIDHFNKRSSKLPFSFDQISSRFTTTDPDYIAFINNMVNIRSVGTRARDFECSVAERLHLKVTGAAHRVGWPRDTKKTKTQFVAHLKKLGFGKTSAYGQEKDGGLDILWLPPLGAIPHTPLLSVQCKNGAFDVSQADVSVGAGSRTLGEHNGLLSDIHVPCVLFNDYIFASRLTKKKMNWVPLGLSDLGSLQSSQATLALI